MQVISGDIKSNRWRRHQRNGISLYCFAQMVRLGLTQSCQSTVARTWDLDQSTGWSQHNEQQGGVQELCSDCLQNYNLKIICLLQNPEKSILHFKEITCLLIVEFTVIFGTVSEIKDFQERDS